MNALVGKLLRKNTSAARLIGFILSEFAGLLIITGALQFYLDARTLAGDEGNFLNNDYLVLNKRVTGADTWGGGTTVFSREEIEEIEKQPWVKSVAPFKASDYRVWASLGEGHRGMSTMMFFESLPDQYLDVDLSEFQYEKGSDRVPIIISRDYLALYNFGFAGSAGLPQLSESLISGIPLKLTMTSDDGRRVKEAESRIVGYSGRYNTILVPRSFMEESNAELGGEQGGEEQGSRVAVEVSSPGDVAIKEYLRTHNYEVAGDKSGMAASYLLKVVVGIVIIIGLIITLLSLSILMLSVSLLIEKNREKLHTLLMLGYDLGSVGAPYRRIILMSSGLAYIMASGCVMLLRMRYVGVLEKLGGAPGNIGESLLAGLVITAVIMILNIVSVRKKVRGSWR